MLRLGRAAWLSVESLSSISPESLPGLLVLLTAVVLVLLDKRKKPSARWLHGYPRTIGEWRARARQLKASALRATQRL